jgi:hypothetical protein
MVLDAAEREGIFHFQLANGAVSLIGLRRVRNAQIGERLANLVDLVDIALIELVVFFVGFAADASRRRIKYLLGALPLAGPSCNASSSAVPAGSTRVAAAALAPAATPSDRKLRRFISDDMDIQTPS